MTKLSTKLLTKLAFLAALCCSLHVIYVHAEVISGFAHSIDGFAFLGKFCFDFTPKDAPHQPAGNINVKLYLHPHIHQVHTHSQQNHQQQNQQNHQQHHPQHHFNQFSHVQPLELLVYDDQEFSWPAVYNKGLTCHARQSKAIVAMPVVFNNHNMFEFNTNIFEHIRPRFWYLVLASPTCSPIYGITYSIHFKNTISPLWQQEFGVNEQGLNNVHVFFFAAASIIVIVYGFGVRKMYQHEQGFSQLIANFPPIHSLFATGLFCVWLSLALDVLHYSAFSHDGQGTPFLHLISTGLRVGSQICLLTLLLLLAQGWSISTESITDSGKVLFVIVGMGVSYFLLLLWAGARDRASTLYIYDSFPGMLIIMLNLAAGAVFAYSIYHTRANETHADKKQFYTILGLAYLPWFVSLSVVVAVATALSPWVRERIVASIQISVDLVAYSGLIYFLWPTRFNHYFKVVAPSVSEEYDSLINETN